MATAIAITEGITSLAEAETKLGLYPATDEAFFQEWLEPLPALSQAEQTRLDLIKQRCLYQRKMGQIAEGAVNFVVMSPLLELAGFYDPPFRLRSEVSVKLEVETRDELFRGRVDALVLQDKLWIVLLESKETSFNVSVALPQALAYLATQSQQPTYGLVSNGEYFMFLKLAGQQYRFSDDFSLHRRQNELYPVLQILKRFAADVIAN
jgi:hypothetical protein